MNSKGQLLLSFATLLLTTTLSNGVCPDEELIDPCICQNDIFYCGGTKLENFKKLFDRISKSLDSPNKHFDILFLNNTAITEIEDDMFRDITFREIRIKDCKNLRRIYAHAFSGWADKVEIFMQDGDSLLGEDDQHVSELFAALSSLVNVREIKLGKSKLRQIPDNAFSNVEQTKLTHLEISRAQLTTIGKNAFYYLANLRYIYLQNQQINKIPVHAFDFQKPLNLTLEIHLESNNIEDASIEVNAFTESKRPLDIRMAHNQITHLTPEIFKPIFKADPRNKIDLTDNPFKCSCFVAWLVREKATYNNSIVNAVCKGNPHPDEELWTLKQRDFIDCPDTFLV